MRKKGEERGNGDIRKRREKKRKGEMGIEVKRKAGITKTGEPGDEDERNGEMNNEAKRKLINTEK